MVTKEHIISEIQRTAIANQDRPLGKEGFAAETGIKESDWSGRYWTKWGDVVVEAGYEPNQMQGAYPHELLLSKLASFIHELGHFPCQCRTLENNGVVS